MELIPAEELFVVVLCPRLAPMAHGSGCSFRHLFLPPRPGQEGDWSGTVTDLDQIRVRFPGVLFHTCLRDALQYGIRQANAIAAGLDPPPSPSPPVPPSEGERRSRGGHPYGRA
ncbi:hypothetical protein ACIHFD_59845 [Nonomuraea sp. NPDC051941]|uniref:hypothetical protein n=1 Tax=Nonomuraea sp. NPDC051941 TaxID=3364373 RepID=UPI0037CAA47A